MTDNELASAALRLAQLGYSVLPVTPLANKPPLTLHGFKDATTDSSQIEIWWKRWPEANVAIATEGLLVLDRDPAGGGWLADSPDKLASLASGPMSCTPRGGRHYVFRQPAGKHWRNTQSDLAPGIDTRADGGYAVMPPSRRGDGIYRWEEGCALAVPPQELPEPPPWLIELLDGLQDGPGGAGVRTDAPLPSNAIPHLQRSSTLTSLGGTMRRRGMSQAEIEAALLQANRDRCIPPMEEEEVRDIARSVAKYEPNQVAVAMAEGLWLGGQTEAPTGGPIDPGPFPADLIEQLPDIMKRAMAYYVSCAIEVQPVLFLGSMVATTGALLGHRVCSPSGLRTNIYTTGITGTGGGKEATREIPRKIMQHAGLESICGPEDFASDSGLLAAVQKENPILFQIDEFGRLLHTVNSSGKRDPHLANIATALLKLYSKAGSIYRGKAYADTKKNYVIDQPHVCLYGTTVAEAFWRAIDTRSLDEGFLPRLLIFESHAEPSPGGAIESDPPPELYEFFARWRESSGDGNLVDQVPRPAVVPYTAEGEGVFREFKVTQKQELRRHGELGVLWSRACENAGKLAIIYACWRSHEPQVDREAADWAIRLMTYLVQHTLYEASFQLCEGAFHERCQRIRNELRRRHVAGQVEVSGSELCRATRNMARRERSEAIETLVEQGAIHVRPEGTPGRTALWYRLCEPAFPRVVPTDSWAGGAAREAS